MPAGADSRRMDGALHRILHAGIFKRMVCGSDKAGVPTAGSFWTGARVAEGFAGHTTPSQFRNVLHAHA